MNANLLHHYRRFRQHQAEHDGGGAWPGEHALCAYRSARSHIHFLERLSADVASSKRRSKAAKSGWKKRSQLAA
jgi:hypothetical protein